MDQKVETGKVNENTYLIDIEMLGLEGITSVYVLESEKTALIDGGTKNQSRKILQKLKSFDLLQLDFIIITHNHWDHNQAVPELLEEMPEEVKVLAHPKAIPLLENPEKKEYDFGIEKLSPIENIKPIKGGEIIDLGKSELQVIETPGHSFDSISLYDPDNKNIFVSDAIMDKTDNTTLVPAAMPPSCHPEQYSSTLEKLRKINWNSICLGHYGIYYGEDVKNILDEGKLAWEVTWEFFEKNVEKLDNIDWITNTLVQEIMPNSKTVERTGTAFTQEIINWLIDGYKIYKDL